MTPAPARTDHRTVRILLCVLVVTMIVATVSVLASGAATAEPVHRGCPRWTAVLVPGTGEAPPADTDAPTGMLAPIATGLHQRYGTDIEVRTLTYTASATPYSASETQGEQTLSATLHRLCRSTHVILGGYSQGAHIVGDVATDIGHDHGPLPASRIVAVALISDPRRNPDTPQLANPAPGEGIAGPRHNDFGTLADRVRTVCVTGDIYCATSPQDSPALTALGRAFTGNTLSTTPSTPTHQPSQSSTPATSSALSPHESPDSPQQILEAFGGLDPTQVVEQVATALAGIAEFAANVPAIVGDLTQLPALIARGDLPGLHRVSGDLNNQFAPVVQMADRIDLHLIARALMLASPLDTSGWTAIAAQIVNVLAGLDIARLATDIGNAQEIAWDAAHKLATGDPAAAALALSGLIPVATDLATTAAAALTGEAGARLSGLARTFTASATPATGNALTDLVRQGVDAARFGASGVHHNGYPNALEQVLHWMTRRIDTTR